METRMAGTSVLYRRDGNIGIIAFNRPDRLNAITVDLLSDLLAQLDAARKDDEANAVILTGEGRAFCAGEDLKETVRGKPIETWKQEAHLFGEIQRAILRLDKPLIAAVQGHAVGGGSAFAMCCDIRIAAEDARFGFPETRVGLTVVMAGTKLLTQLVGLGKAKELILTGDVIDAQEAARLGLVNHVVPNEDLMDAAMAMARKLAERSPVALSLSRAALNLGLDADFEHVLELESDHLLQCVADQGYLAYVQKTLAEMKKG
jgi:enoyl-CoA hydratase